MSKKKEQSLEIFCKNCADKFTVADSQKKRKFCSQSCYWESRRKRVECKCNNCGKSFSVTLKTIKEGRGKHCSVKCQMASQKNGKYVKCENETCQEVFYLPKSRLNNTKRNFCSQSCRRKREMVKCKNCSKKFYPPHDKEYAFCTMECHSDFIRTERNCKNCGKLFSVLKSVKDHRGYCCSSECNKEYQNNKYNKTRNLRIRISANKYARRQVNQCSEIYVRNYMKRYYSLEEVPKSLVKVKQEHLKIKRELKNKQL